MFWFLVAVVTLGTLALLPAQTATTNPPTASPVSPTVVIRIPPALSTTNDPLVNLMLQQPSIDTDSPVAVMAEFEPPQAVVGTRATYRLVITALKGAIKLPDPLPAPAGLELKTGAQVETFAQLGTKLQPRSTFLYHALAATTGVFVMPAFPILVYGKSVPIPESKVTFLTSLPPTPELAPNLQLKARLPDGDIYVGQAVPIRIYCLNTGYGTLQGLVTPQIVSDAFLQETAPIRHSREITAHQGKNLMVFVLEWVITPLKHGEHTVLVQAQAIVGPDPNQPQNRIPAYNPLIDSDPFVISVKSLPQSGELPGFTGAIGEFQLDPPRLSTNQAQVGEPLTLAVTIRGQGNLGRLTPPRIKPTPGWQIFPPSADPNVAYQSFLAGIRSFTFTLIPLDHRVQGTPAIPFSYFHPQTHSYVDLTIPPVPLKIVGPASAGRLARQPDTVPEEVMPQFDVADTSPDAPMTFAGPAEHPGPVSTLKPLQQRPGFILLQVAFAAILAGLWAQGKYRRYLEQHPEIILRRGARRETRRQLRALRRAWGNQDVPGFVSSAVKALQVVSAPLAKAHPNAMACSDVLAGLAKDTTADNQVRLIRQLFAAADAYRFGSPPALEGYWLELRSEVEGVVDHLYRRL